MLVATSDPQFDLSLRFLSLVVSGAIVGALLWYLVLILQPLAYFSRGEVGPPSWAAMPEVVAALPPVTLVDATERSAAPAATVFRCEIDGSVTYTDRPCDRGGMRVLRLPRR
jgi:hypothetical protein